MFKLYTAIFTLLFWSNSSFAQQKITLIGDENSPVSMAYVYDCNSDFIGITNDKGQLDIHSSCLPIKISHYDYKNLQTENVTVPISLSLKIQEIDEVKAVPIVKMDLYNSIIAKSNQNLSESVAPIFGIYFETFMLVDEIKKDTLIITKTCQMAISKEIGKKKNTYSLYTNKGEQMYQSFSNSKTRDKDSVKMYDASSKLLPKFSTNFLYDLKQPKKFKISYEENEIKRLLGEDEALIFEKGKGKTTRRHEVEYQDSLLSNWRRMSFGNKEYTGQVIFVNFDEQEMSLEYGSDEYQLNKILNKLAVTFAFQEDKAKIYVVNGFIPDSRIQFDLTAPISSVAEYFKTLPFTQNVASYYQF